MAAPASTPLPTSSQGSTKSAREQQPSPGSGNTTKQPLRRSQRTAVTARRSRIPKSKSVYSEKQLNVAKPAHRYLLRIAIDYGTFHLNAMYQIKDTQGEDQFPIELVYFQPNDPNSPMWLHVTDEGQLQWGHSVQDRYQNQQLALETVIRLPKLAMHTGQDRAGLTMVKDQIRQLEHGFDNLVKLIQVHLQGVVDFTFEQFAESRDAATLSKQGFDVRAVDKEIHLGVPQAWDPMSNEIMSNAAINLSLKGQLVVEPQCVAAFTIHFESMRSNARKLHQLVGGSIRQIVVDAGGGTVDLIKFEMSAKNGAKSKMKTIGSPRGELIGSALINDDFVDQIYLGKGQVSDGSDVADFLKGLGMSDNTFRAQVSHQFERFKVGVASMQREESIRVNGTNTHGYITFDKSLVLACIDRGAQKVVDMVASLIDDQTQVLILSGGFGKSHLLKDALKKRWPDRHLLEAELEIGKTSLPVAHGALLRHEKVELGALPSGFSYFWTQNYTYNEKVHLDAKKDPSLIRLSKWRKKGSKARIVEERITNLLKKEDIPDGKHILQATSFSYWWMYEDDLKICVDIYWSRDNLEQEKALRDYRSIQDDPINPQYRLWKRVEVEVTEQLLAAAGYDSKHETSEGRLAYNVAGRIILKAKEAVMEVVFQIARKGKTGSAKNCGPNSKSKHLLNVATATVWNSTFSHTTAGDDWTNPAMAAIGGEEEGGNSDVDDSETLDHPQYDYEQELREEDLERLYGITPSLDREPSGDFKLRVQTLWEENKKHNEAIRKRESRRSTTGQRAQHVPPFEGTNSSISVDVDNMSPVVRREQEMELQVYENIHKTRKEYANPDLLLEQRRQRAARLGDASDLIVGGDERYGDQEQEGEDRNEDEGEEDIEHGNNDDDDDDD